MIEVDGNILDLSCDFELKLSEQLSESAQDAVRKEVALPISLPYSDTNDKLFKAYGINNRFNTKLKDYESNEFQGKLNAFNDKDCKYNLQLVKAVNNWADCMEAIKICELDLGTFEHTYQNIIDFWNSNKDAYNGIDGALPFVGNFGSQYGTGTATLQDVRYKVSPLHILKAAFKECGINFVSPVMENDRHLWAYLNKVDYWNYDNRGEQLKAGTSLQNQIIPEDETQLANYQTIDFDNGANLATPPGRTELMYFNNSQYPENIEVCVNSTIFNNSAFNMTTNVGCYIYDDLGNVISTTGFYDSNYTLTPFQTVNLTNKKTISLPPNSYLIIAYYSSATGLSGGNPIEVLQSIARYCNVSQNHATGDIIPIAQTLDCEITAMSLFKEMITFYNGLFSYDSSSRTLFMSSPYGGSDYKGFYTDLSKVKKLSVLCDSRTGSSIVEPANERIYKFADSNDTYVENELNNGNRSDNEVANGALSFNTTLGFDNSNKLEITNSLFEPTLNAFSTQYGVGGLIIDGSYWLPQYIDNEDGELSEEVGFRIAYVYNGGQIVAGNTVSIGFEDNQVFNFPLVYQELDDSVTSNNPDFDGRQFTYTELYEKYYKDYINRTAANIKETYEAILTYKEYKSLSFRDKVRINYKGQSRVYLLTYKRFNSCGKPVKLEFIRERREC